MDDIFFWILALFIGIPILWAMFSALIDKAKEPYEYKIKAIDIEAKEKECTRKTLEAEKKIAQAEEKIQAAKQEEKHYVEKRQDLINRYNKAKAELDTNAHRQALEMLSYSNDLLLAFAPQCDISELHQGIMEGKLQKIFDAPPEINDLRISVKVKSQNGIYITTLKDCSCKDFQFRKKPCKHMIYLYYIVSMLHAEKPLMDEAVFKTYSEINAKKTVIGQLESEKADLQNDILNLNYKQRAYRSELNALESKLERKKQNEVKELEDFQNLLKDKNFRFSKMAQEFSDISTKYFDDTAYYLSHKTRPAYSAADTVRLLKRETKEHVRDLTELRLKLAYIEKMFPNINDIFDSGFDEESEFELETEENTDRVRLFLSPEEYSRLSTAEKNQLALDRYVEQRKSKWQIGRDYEMYVGHKLENKGYKVQYTGIIENLEDMGRDLIATNSKQILIIQCKNWSQEKTIHEKHIFQLYGTVVLYKLDNPYFEVKGVFVTTTKLSDKARAVAAELGIKVIEQLPLGEFPRIKCNVNRTTGERIYHLPFDQQYDRTIISKKDGELYAFTVREAEDLGFRRAWKHFQ